MKKHTKLIILGIAAAGLLVLGGIIAPRLMSSADENHYADSCPAGSSTIINTDGTVTCGDGSTANMTPDTPYQAPAQTPAVAPGDTPDTAAKTTTPHCTN